MTSNKARFVLLTGLIAALSFAAHLRSAFAFSEMYAAREISADAQRLETAVRKIYRIGIEPALTARERRSLGRVVIEFPRPSRRSQLLNFYAYRKPRTGHIAMPLLSLKQLEDLTTAYAWLQVNGYSLATIDLYFAMVGHKLVIDWPGQRFLDILTALGVPKDAYKQPGVDSLSLSLRNEAFAFILAHELGHLLYRHRSYAEITTAQARADELQSDQFALDILLRTNTPPMGATLFFQAQVHAMPHRGQFKSEARWEQFLRKASTHPLSTDRIRLMARTFAEGFSRKRPAEAATWRFIGAGVARMANTLEDVDIQRCIVRTATHASLVDLKPTRQAVGLEGCMTR